MQFVNEAGWDRILRVVLAVVLLVLGWGGIVTGAVGIVFKILGIVLLLTGLIGYCPLYSLLRVRTHKE